jgi:hypothetical protein
VEGLWLQATVCLKIVAGRQAFNFKLIEADFFQMPQLHKHFNVSGNPMKVFYSIIVIISFLRAEAVRTG